MLVGPSSTLSALYFNNFIGVSIPANAKARAFAAAFYRYLSNEAGQDRIIIQPNPVRVISGGLENIPADGFRLLSGNLKGEGSGKSLTPISGEKIVYTLD